MKKQLLLLAGTALFMASCGSNNNQAQQTQAQIDSTVNAKLAQHDAANDSALKAVEAEKEAAVHKEHEEKRHEEAQDRNTSASDQQSAPSTNQQAPAQGGLQGHSDQNQANGNSARTQSTQGGGLRSHSDQNQTQNH